MDDSTPASPESQEEVLRAVRSVSPEVASGVVAVRAIGRLPGSRTKIALASVDASIDAIGSCVGLRGVRLQAIRRALGDEIVDLIPWVDDPYRLIKFAVAPFRVYRIELFPAERRALVFAQLEPHVVVFGSIESIWITASRLTGWHLQFVRSDAA